MSDHELRTAERLERALPYDVDVAEHADAARARAGLPTRRSAAMSSLVAALRRRADHLRAAAEPPPWIRAGLRLLRRAAVHDLYDPPPLISVQPQSRMARIHYLDVVRESRPVPIPSAPLSTAFYALIEGREP
jgi:hypothetical protein